MLAIILLAARGALSRAFGFLSSLNVAQLGCVALAAFALFQHFELAGAHRHGRHLEEHGLALSRALGAERAAHAADVARYRAAAAEARAADAAHKVQVETAQDQITKEINDDHEKSLAALRARFERLRAANAAANHDPRGPGGAPVPALPAAPADANAAPGQDRLPDSDRLTCSAIALQLNDLQEWIRREIAVPRDAPKAL